jgi:hypothetical protein
MIPSRGVSHIRSSSASELNKAVKATNRRAFFGEI